MIVVYQCLLLIYSEILLYLHISWHILLYLRTTQKQRFRRREREHWETPYGREMRVVRCKMWVINIMFRIRREKREERDWKWKKRDWGLGNYFVEKLELYEVWEMNVMWRCCGRGEETHGEGKGQWKQWVCWEFRVLF